MHLAVGSIDWRFEFSQLDAALSREFGVEVQNLDREVDFVDDTLTSGMVFRPKFEIIGLVVGSITVFVVHGFAFAKRTAEHLFHHKPMLETFFPAGKINSHVPSGVEMSLWVDRTPRAPFEAARLAAKFLLHVVARRPTVFQFAQISVSGFAAELALKSRHWFAVHTEQLYQHRRLVKESV